MTSEFIILTRIVIFVPWRKCNQFLTTCYGTVSGLLRCKSMTFVLTTNLLCHVLYTHEYSHFIES